MKHLIIALLMLVSFWSCKEHHVPLAHKLKKHDKEIVDPIPKEMSENLYQGKTNPTEYQGKALKVFEVEARKNQISHFPCAKCHSGKVPKGDVPKSHWDQKIQHATGMKCASCHNAEAEMNLKTFKTEEIDFDHSYKLCQQCHFQQVDDWTGGAHGKRLGGWAGERKVKNCASCHDPHKPAFESKIPAIEMPEM